MSYDELDLPVLIGIIVAMVILTVGLSGVYIGSGYSQSHPQAETIMSQNNQWQSDGYTYTNFTTTGDHIVIVRCNYYHVGSIITFPTGYWYWFRLYVDYSSPNLVEGC